LYPHVNPKKESLKITISTETAHLASRTKHRFVSTSRKKRALRGAAYIMCPRGASKKAAGLGQLVGELPETENQMWDMNGLMINIRCLYNH